MAGGTFGGGDGTSGFPYLVEDAQDFNAVRNNMTKYFKQVANIDLIGYANWIPIGTVATPFGGTYDGNNRTIDKLTINSTSGTEPTGLFGKVSGGTLKNITLINASVSSNHDDTGALVGYAVTTTVSKCSSSGSVTGANYVGGLAGTISSGCTAQYNSSSCTVIGTSKVGGLLGYSASAIFNSYSTGSAEGTYAVGGISGQMDSAEINYCYSTADIKADNIAGGIIGQGTSNYAVRYSFALNRSIKRNSGSVQTAFGDIYGQGALVTQCSSLDTLQLTSL